MNMKKGKPAKSVLYDLINDQAEKRDVSKKNPAVLKEMQNEFNLWFESVQNSAEHESGCYGISKPDAEADSWYEW